MLWIYHACWTEIFAESNYIPFEFTETTDKAKKQVGTFDVMTLFTLAINRDMLHRTWGHE